MGIDIALACGDIPQRPYSVALATPHVSMQQHPVNGFQAALLRPLENPAEGSFSEVPVPTPAAEERETCSVAA
jgi:hypothetical protein